MIGGYLAASTSAATATANLGVSATVTSNCTISTVALAFGSYDPVVNPPVLAFDRERARVWIGKGATMSPTVQSLLERPEAPAPAA